MKRKNAVLLALLVALALIFAAACSDGDGSDDNPVAAELVGTKWEGSGNGVTMTISFTTSTMSPCQFYIEYSSPSKTIEGGSGYTVSGSTITIYGLSDDFGLTYYGDYILVSDGTNSVKLYKVTG